MKQIDKCTHCNGDGCIPYTNPRTDVEEYAICNICNGEGGDRLRDTNGAFSLIKRSELFGDPIDLCNVRDDLMEDFGTTLTKEHPEWFSDSYKESILSPDAGEQWMDEKAKKLLAEYFVFLALGAEGDTIQRFKSTELSGEVILRKGHVVSMIITGAGK